MLILIIEDSDILGPMLVRTLRSKGHETILCQSIGAADDILDAADGKWPDIILTDKDLPDGDGWKWAYRWHDCIPPVVFMTGNPPEKVSHPYFHKGQHPISVLHALISELEKK